MTGFLDEDETIVSRGDERVVVKPLKIVQADCESCGLYKSCLTPYMKPYGKGRLRILIIGEAPGETEDRKGRPFVGESGRVIRGIISSLGYDMDQDCWTTNALNCRPPKNASPTGLQIIACRRFLKEDIAEFRPHVIIPVGKWAIESLIGERLTGRIAGAGISDFAGEIIPDQELKAWICPTWHPSYYLHSLDDRDDGAQVIKLQMERHIEAAFKLAENNVPVPVYDSASMVEIIKQPREVITYLKGYLKHPKTRAFDYETTGLKPYRQGHYIYSASLFDGDKAVSFLCPKPGSEHYLDWVDIWGAWIADPEHKKIAHSGKFEGLWSRHFTGQWIRGLVWDTEIAAKCIANQKDSNLKFVTYTNFGILGYDASIEDYLEASEPEKKRYGANAINRIGQADVDKVLLYGGQDSVHTKWAADIQPKRLSKNQVKGVVFFVDRAIRLAKSEYIGIQFDNEKVAEIVRGVQEHQDRIERSIRKLPEMERWDRSSPMKISSKDDLKYLFFERLGYEPIGKTEKGNPSLDKDFLASVDTVFAFKLREWQRLETLMGFLKQFKRESINGEIHPFFNLTRVPTFRSSADSPNFQAIPKREPEMGKPIRRLLRPRLNHRLREDDYKAIEVAVAACYTQDPVLLGYVRDPKSDMHGDMAKRIFLSDSFTDEERHLAKNGFVFAEFYGDYYGQIAPGMWRRMESSTKQHLYEKGIRTEDDFTDHLRYVEDWFWNDQYPVYTEWKEKTYAQYLKKGYVEGYTGFRCYGPMSRNQVINYRIQGSAFHCLLWTYGRVQEEMERRKMDSVIIGQIHDAMITDYGDEEEAEIDALIYDYGTQKIREFWDWIIVPLSIDSSRSKINGNWAEMEKRGLLKGVV